MKSKTIFVFVPLLLLAVAMAASPQAAEWKGTIEQKNGVKIIKNPSEPLYGDIVFDLEENLSIGNPDDENSAFYKSVFMAVDSEGSILVLDRENCRIQKFDEDGNFLCTIGRKGQGPGEFDRPLDLILDSNDDIYVSESRKLHQFNKTGEYIKSILLGSLYRSIGITKESHILAMTQTLSPEEASDDVCLLTPDGKKIKTVASFPKPRPDYTSKIRFSDLSVEHRLHLCQLDADYTIYCHSSEYRLYVIDLSGEVSLIFDKDEPPIPITQKEKNKEIEARLKRAKKSGLPISRIDVVKGSVFPETRPFFIGLQHDDENNIYVFITRSYSADSKNNFSSYDLFNKNGYYLYRVKIQHSPRIIKHRHLYNFRPDEEGYIQIKRYKIKNWNQIKKGLN